MAETSIIAGRRRADQRPSLIGRSDASAPQRRAEARVPGVAQVLPDALSPLVLAGAAVLLTVVLMVVTR